MNKMAQTTALAAGLEMVEVFREECRTDIGSQSIACFLHIAMRGEMPMFDLIGLLGLSGAAVSRNISMLGKGFRGEPGLELVEAYEDEMFRRRKLVRLTEKGKKLVAKVVKALNKYATEVKHVA